MLYSVAHIGWVLGIGLIAALSVLAYRRANVPALPIRIAIAALLVGFELQRFFTVHMAFPGRMPFYLCNVSTWAAVLACLTLNPVALDFLYFNGLAAAAVALLMPDMGAAWPAPFFLNHGGVILAASVLVFGGMAKVRPAYPFRAFAMILVYFFSAAFFDWLYGTNYSFMWHKPSGVTLVNYLGPWPWYWLPVAAIDNIVIWLLWRALRVGLRQKAAIRAAGSRAVFRPAAANSATSQTAG